MREKKYSEEYNEGEDRMDNQTVNILMVDDREENLLALEAVLSSPKYNLIKAISGEQALKSVLKEDFAVIIMDVQMPGLNGFETAQMIRRREKTKAVPIIFMTALSQTNENILQGYSVGAIDYIIKPFDPLILTCKVEGFVSLYLNQKKVEEQSEIIAKHTKELEEAYKIVQKNEEILEGLVKERTNELFNMNKKLQQEIAEKEASLLKLEESKEFMQQTEKLTVIGELAAGIAHEIRNPLTSLKGFTQLLGNKEESNQSYIDIMINEIERINTIVSELLLLAKPNKLEFKKIELGNILQSIITLMNAHANLYGVTILLKSSMALDTCFIYGIENKIKQVFINLLKNAIESMEEGGEVIIEIVKKENHFDIHFIDGGCGIPRELLPKLGQPFFTTKDGGTGLGLMVCYSIIESHKGAMAVESLNGHGTTVSVTLPMHQSAVGTQV